MQINQSFLPPDAMLARYMLPSCVRPSVCLSQAGVLLKRLGELSWNGGFLPSIPLCVIKKAGYQKIKVLPSSLWGFVPNSGLRKFRHGQVDRVVNRTRRRRRRSSLLTTPIRQSTSRGCLLQVDQL